MTSDLIYVPAPQAADNAGFLELARVGSGRIFKKMILRKGDDFVHPNDPSIKVPVTQELMDSLQRNYEAGYCDIVQVPVCDEKNAHSEDPLRNMGEVIDLEIDDKGLYALIDARKPEQAEQLGKTLIGASAMMHLNYQNSKTGKKVGPTLLHVAVTNRPYITQMDGFEEVLAASATFSSADNASDELPVVLSAVGVDDVEQLEHLEPEMPKTLADILAELDSADAAVVQAELAKVKSLAAAPAPVAALDTDTATQLSNVLGLSASDISLTDIAAGVVELSGRQDEMLATMEGLKNENDTLRLSAAESTVDDLIGAQRILPKQRDLAIKLSMQEDKSDYEALISEQPLVSLSEDGVTVYDQPDSGEKAPIIESYAERMAALRTSAKR